MTYKLSIPVLSRAVDAACRVVPTKATLPILEYLHFDFSETDATITGTNLEQAIRVHVPLVGNAKSGRYACIPARRLKDLLKVLREGDVTLTFGEGHVKITAGGGAYKLATNKPEEFPSLANFEKGETHSYKVDAETMLDAFGRTSYAMSTDDLRPAMCGVLLRVEKSGVKFVATDGHRLGIYSHNGIKGVPMDLIVPNTAVDALAGLFSEGMLDVVYGKTIFRVSSGGTEFLTRLIDEQYPNYESVIPKDGENTLTFKRKELLDTLQRVSLFSNALTHQVRFRLSKDVLVSAEDVDAGGEAAEKIDATYKGSEMEVGFNGSFLVDLLRHTVAEMVVFRFTTSTRATVVEIDDEVSGLVMPVRVNG